MEEVVPWQALIDMIEPSYPKTSKKGGLDAHPLVSTSQLLVLTSGELLPGEQVPLLKNQREISRDEALKLWASKRQEDWSPCKRQW